MNSDQLPVASGKTAWIHAKQHLAASRLTVVTIVVLYSLTAALAVVPSWILGQLIEDYETSTRETVAIWIAIAALFVLGEGFFTVLSRVFIARWIEITMRRLRDQFVVDVLRINPRTLDGAKVGDVTSRATTDVSMLNQSMRLSLPEATICIITVVVIGGALLIISPYMALALLFGIPFMVPSAVWALRRALTAHKDEHAARAQAADTAGENIQGARVIEALSLRPQRDAVLSEAVHNLWQRARRILHIHNVLFPSIDFGKNMILLAGLVIGVVAHQGGHASLGEIVTAMLLLRFVGEPLAMLIIFFQTILAGTASFARIIGVGESSDDGDFSPVVSPDPGRIELNQVSFAYHEGHEVLHGIDLRVQPGEKIAIVGVSGSGKTTLGRLITGALQADSGEVTVDGLAAKSLSHQQYRRIALLVNQEHHVFSASLRDNALLGVAGATDEEIASVLATVGANSWLDSLPEGLDTKLDHRVDPLDETIIQRLALARILLSRASILVLDEATASLSGRDAQLVERRFNEATSHRTVITVAHRLSTAVIADRVIVMENGQIVESGHHEELVQAGNFYARLWKTWRGGN